MSSKMHSAAAAKELLKRLLVAIGDCVDKCDLLLEAIRPMGDKKPHSAVACRVNDALLSRAALQYRTSDCVHGYKRLNDLRVIDLGHSHIEQRLRFVDLKRVINESASALRPSEDSSKVVFDLRRSPADCCDRKPRHFSCSCELLFTLQSTLNSSLMISNTYSCHQRSDGTQRLHPRSNVCVSDAFVTGQRTYEPKEQGAEARTKSCVQAHRKPREFFHEGILA